MKNKVNLRILSLLLLAVTAYTSCKKHTNDENLVVAPEQAHYMNVNGSKLEAISSDDSTWIKVGLTTNSSSTRTVTIQPISKTAFEGTDYTISKKVITFAPGQLIDSFYVKPINVANYLTGRKDTILFNIIQPSVTPSSYNSTYQWILRGPCFASDINIGEFDALLGTYADSQDDPFGSPYKYGTPMSIKSWTQTGATTARVVINNLWDGNPNWGDIPFIVDFTDPNDVHVLPITTITSGDAKDVSTTYAGMKPVVRAHANGAYGTLNWCDQKWVLEYQVGVYNPATGTILGYFPNQFTSSLAR